MWVDQFAKVLRLQPTEQVFSFGRIYCNLIRFIDFGD